MNYAYGRVSAADQNLDRQIDCFLSNGVNKRHIFTDKKSGKDFERENYKKLMRRLKKGDMLIIKSIDRLGRNYDMIIEEWRHITKDIGADILVLDMPLLDTRTHDGNLTGKLISDIVLQLLSYVAQQERENIKARQREGIASAKRRGVRFGRPTVPMPDNFLDTVVAYKQKRITLSDALVRTRLKQATFYVLMRRLSPTPYPDAPPDAPAPAAAMPVPSDQTSAAAISLPVTAALSVCAAVVPLSDRRLPTVALSSPLADDCSTVISVSRKTSVLPTDTLSVLKPRDGFSCSAYRPDDSFDNAPSKRRA